MPINWHDYINDTLALLDSPNCPEWYTEGDDRVYELFEFFDIYENVEKNQAVESLAQALPADINDNVGAKELLRLAFPEQSYADLSACTGLNDDAMPTATLASSFNPTVAFDYAWEYAEKRNPAYPDFKKDCTNIASQVLEHGGEPLVPGGTYNSVYEGWWHKGYPLDSHVQSLSWSVADAFMK